jgi:hypothetical protein
LSPAFDAYVLPTRTQKQHSTHKWTHAHTKQNIPPTRIPRDARIATSTYLYRPLRAIVVTSNLRRPSLRA